MKTSKRGFSFRTALLLAFLAALTARCGYRLRGTGGFLPGHIKTMSVPMFKNLTTRFELDLKLTQAVIDELVARGKVEIAADPKAADAVLSGEVVSFAVHPIAFGRRDAADRFNIIVVTKIVLRDNVQRRVIFSNPSYTYTEEYEVAAGSDFESSESVALDRVAEKFARQLIITILEGF